MLHGYCMCHLRWSRIFLGLFSNSCMIRIDHWLSVPDRWHYDRGLDLWFYLLGLFVLFGFISITIQIWLYLTKFSARWLNNIFGQALLMLSSGVCILKRRGGFKLGRIRWRTLIEYFVLLKCRSFNICTIISIIFNLHFVRWFFLIQLFGKLRTSRIRFDRILSMWALKESLGVLIRCSTLWLL